MFHKKDSCWGVTLFRFGRRKLELWFVPRDYACVEHVHKDSDGEFFVVFGKGRNIWRTVTGIEKNIYGNMVSGLIRQMYHITDRTYFKTYTVRANTPHGFSIGTSPMIFLCWETYLPGRRVTSPAADFHPTTTQVS